MPPSTQLSRLSIPLEILHEFVLHDVSYKSLKRWCLVSRALLDFAGPLLYRNVVLDRTEDVVPFLTRLVSIDVSGSCHLD
jgi:hypothetical protein